MDDRKKGNAVTTDDFWTIIDRCTTSTADPESKEEELRRNLEALRPDAIVEFEHHFEHAMNLAYRWDIWAAAYIIQGGCGDDHFMDFRASQIMRGRKAFEQLLHDPDSLTDVPVSDPIDEFYFEGYQYVAMDVYQAKTGEDLLFDAVDSPQEPAGEDWDVTPEDLQRICPKLFAKYGGQHW